MRDAGLREGHEAEIQVGLLVLISLLVLASGVWWISGHTFGGAGVRLFAVTENAGAVSEGDPVTYLGVDVGSVQQVRIQDRRVVLSLEVRTERTGALPADTRAVIRPAGFLGSQLVELEPGRSTRTLGPGDTLQAETVPELQSVAARVGRQATEVLERTNRVLTDSTIADVRDASGALAATVREIRTLVRRQQESVAELVQNLEVTSTRLEAATGEGRLTSTAASLDTLTGRLRDASRDLETSSASLSSILEKVDGGQGSLGKLVNDDRLYVTVVDAVAHLQTASEEIAALSRDLRQNPARYLKISIF